MYKLILIDDEKITLEHLAKSISWGKLGFELVSAFSNSADAVEYIKSNHVDVVFSDIRMPGVDGLEIAKLIYENYPNTLCVLFSAYKEFDYARGAIQYGVTNYLLKPLDFAELEETCLNLKQKLDAQLTSKTIIKELSYFKIQKSINDYLESDNISFESFQESLSLWGIPRLVFLNPICEMHLKLEDFNDYIKNVWSHGLDNFYSALNRISNYEGIYFIPIKYNFDEIDVIIFFSSVSEIALPNALERYIEYFTSQAFEILNIIVNIYSYKPHINFEEFKNSYTAQDTPYKLALKFINMMITGNDNVTLQFVTELVSENELTYLKEFASILLREVITTLNIKEKSVLPKNINSLEDVTTKTKFKELFFNIVQYSAKSGYDAKPSIRTSPLKAAKNYIDEHYAENVTLTDVANYVAFSPSHFSRYFKKETGENFINYLNKVRVEKAKSLLVNTRFKVHEICKMVGYIAPMYFYKVFKQHTGYTAQEYRNIHLKENKE